LLCSGGESVAETSDHRVREWLGKYLVGDTLAISVTLATEPSFYILEHDDWYGNAVRLEE